MNKNFPHIKKVVHLTSDKKALLWQNISEKINNSNKNVITSPLTRHINGEQKNASRFIYDNKKTMIVTIITGISLIFAGGASFAANSSLPGDILYPIKIHVNENVESAFTVGAENEAELQVERIEERIQERNRLAAKGKLSAIIDSKIKNDVSLYNSQYEVEKSHMTDGARKKTSAKFDIKLKQLIQSLEINSNGELNSDVESSVNTTGSNTSVNMTGSIDAITNRESIETSVQENINSNIKSNINSTIDTGVELEGNIKSELNGNLETQINGILDSTINTGIEGVSKSSTEANTNTEVKTDTEVKSNTSTQTNASIGENINGSVNIDTQTQLKNGLSIQ
ncbi:hypothetical protein GW846_04040 [Candidatus Gracilibacteria bacterium]|nr:hypothetical protein [Candidatus Gracilibacteria bacterium]